MVLPSNIQASSSKLLTMYTQKFGCEYFAFGPLSSEAAKMMYQVKNEMPYITNFPEKWIERYQEKNYIEIDPVLKHATTTAHAFTWKELKKQKYQSSKVKKFWRDSEQHGLACGVAVPLHGPLAHSFIFSISSRDVIRCSACINLEEIQLVAYQFYLACANKVDTEPHTINLTEREKEVLYWTANGKSAWDISIILGISEHTVNYHLKNIIKKLDVNNKVSASVKAIRLGLIAL